MVKRKELELNLTIGEAFSQFEEEKMANGIDPSGYHDALYYFLDKLELTEDDYVSIISDSMFNQFVIYLRSTSLALASINHHIRMVRVFLYWCMEKEYVRPYKIKMMKGQEEKIKFATDEEIEALLKVKNRDDFVEMRTYTIICFILATGARSSTVRNIKVEDIDFRNHTVTYRHLKNKKVAVIPLTSQIERILHGYIRTWDTQSDFLFPDVRGGQLSLSALNTSLGRYCKDRNLRPIYPHALRHSFARIFIRNGGDCFILQQMLTHSSLDMTRKYVRLFSDDLRTSDFDQINPLNVLSLSKSRTKVVTKNA